jgi:hypothetical protein
MGWESQMGYVAHLLRNWVGKRDPDRFPDQVGCPRRTIPRLLALGVLGLATLSSSPVWAQASTVPNTIFPTKDFRDVTLRTGAQLRGTLEKLTSGGDVRVAAQYFAERKLRPYLDGLVELSAQDANTKQWVSLFFIPFADPTPKPGPLSLVVAADGSMGPKVLLGTISEDAPAGADGSPGIVSGDRPPPGEPKKPNIEVKDEHVVSDGKIQDGNGTLRKWVMCTVGGCLVGISCLAGGPTPFGIACLCVTCSGSALGCYGQLY